MGSWRDWWFNPNGNMAFDGTKDDSYLQYAITPPTLRFSNDPKNMMIAQDIQVEPGETLLYFLTLQEFMSLSVLVVRILLRETSIWMDSFRICQ